MLSDKVRTDGMSTVELLLLLLSDLTDTFEATPDPNFNCLILKDGDAPTYTRAELPLIKLIAFSLVVFFLIGNINL